MARAYRTYLLDTSGQPPLAQRCKLRPRLAYAAAAPTVHVQLAEKRRLTRMSGDGALMIKTRFEEVSTIVKIMKAAGLESAVVVLNGWNCEGRDGLYPTRFPVESAVGGADAMTRAINDVRTAGYLPGALDNYTDMYRRSPAFNGDFTCLQLGGEPWRGGVWAGGQSYVICPKQALDRYVQRDMRRLYDLRLEGLLFLDHCPGPGILSCCHEQHPLTRAQYARAIGDIIRAAQSTFGLCRVSGLSVFAALMADSCVLPVVDTPHIDGLGEDWFADETVPFLPIALHGLILPAADAQADLLRVVEYGAAPIYSVTAGDAAQVVDKMRDFCPRYISQIAPLANEFIESHETPEEGLIRTRYSNGVSVLINRTGKPVELDGVPVAPRDFQVRQC